MRRAAVVLAVVLARVAGATLLFTTGFEGVTNPNDNANTSDSVEMFEYLSGSHATGSTNARIQQVGNGACTANATPWACCSGAGTGKCNRSEAQGGHKSSKFAIRVAPPASAAAYLMLPREDDQCTGSATCTDAETGLSGFHCECCNGAATGGNCQGVFNNQNFDQFSATVAVHLETAPTTASRTILEFQEAQTTRIGCSVRITTGRKLELWYGDPNASPQQIGVAAGNLQAQRCTTPDDFRKPCTSGTVANDCQPTGGACGTCSAANPTACFWADVTLTQVNGSGVVTCTLDINGLTAASGTVNAPGVLKVRDLRLGATRATEAGGSMVAYFDDLAVDSEKASPGYTITVGPSRDGIMQWTKSSGGATAQSLVWDWVDGNGVNATPFQYSNSNEVHVTATNKKLQFPRSAPYSGQCDVTGDCGVQGGGTCASNLCPNATDANGYTRVVIPATDAVSFGGVDVLAMGATSGTGARTIGTQPAVCPAVKHCVGGSRDTLACTVESTADATNGCPGATCGGSPACCRATCSTTSECTPGNATSACYGGECLKCTLGGEATTDLVSDPITADHLWARTMFPLSPSGTTWTLNDITNLGWQFTSRAWGGGTATISSTLAYIRADRKILPPRTLRDHSQRVKPCSAHTDCASPACSSATDYTSTAGAARTCGWCEGNCSGGPTPGAVCAVDADCGTGGTCTGKGCLRDGKLVVATKGDSTNGGTHAATCSNDGQRACSQKDYCNGPAWNLLTGFHSSPPGGCGRDDSQCRKCSGRLTQNGQTGWACTADAQCPNSGATCNQGSNLCREGNAATADTTTPCCAGETFSGTACGGLPCCDSGPYQGQSVDVSCNGLGGTCQTTATCDLSCPGGTCSTEKWCAKGNSSVLHEKCTADGDCTGGGSGSCQPRACSDNNDCRSGISSTRCIGCGITDTCSDAGTCPSFRTAWGQWVGDDLAVDTLLTCSVDGEHSATLAQQTVGDVLQGKGGCEVTIGFGRCACTAAADCGAGGTCTSQTTGSACSGGDTTCVCTAGALDKVQCHSSVDCSGDVCVTDPPDYLLVLEGVNDMKHTGTAGEKNSQCRGYTSVGMIPCDPAFGNLGQTPTLCQSDAECAGVSAASECYGFAYEAKGGLALQSNASGGPTADTATILNNGPCIGDATINGQSYTCTTPLAWRWAIYDLNKSAFGSIPDGRLSMVSGDCRTGYTLVGNFCHRNCTVATAVADCGAAATVHGTSAICQGWCNAGSSRAYQSCSSDGECPGSTCNTQKVCRGECTQPSDSVACATDADCRGRVLFEEGTLTVDGQTLPEGTGSGYTTRFSGHCVGAP